MLLLAATSPALAQKKDEGNAQANDCPASCAKTCPKVEEQCCFSGHKTVYKEDKCGCPITCDACAVPEGFTCNPDRDDCDTGLKCVNQHLSMAHDLLGDIWVCQSQWTVIGNKMPDHCMGMLEEALEDEKKHKDRMEQMKEEGGKPADGAKPAKPAEGGKTRRKRQADKPEGEKPEGEKPEGEKPEGEKPAGEKPEGEKPEGEKPEGEKPEDSERPPPKPEDGEKPEGERPEDEEKPEMMPSEDHEEGHDKEDHDWEDMEKPEGDHDWEDMEKPEGDHDWEDADWEDANWDEDHKPEHGFDPESGMEWMEGMAEPEHGEDHKEEGGMWMGFTNPLKMLSFMAMCSMDVIEEEGRPKYKRAVVEVEKCESIEEQPTLAVNVLTDLKKALENGKGKGEGLLEAGTIEDVMGLTVQLQMYLEKLETDGGPFLEPKKIDPLKNQAFKLEQKLWATLEKMDMGMEQIMEMDDHDEHDKDMDHDEGKPMMPGDKDKDNEIDDEMKMAGVDKESVAKELEDMAEDMHSHAMSAFGKLDMLCWGTIVLLIIGLAL